MAFTKFQISKGDVVSIFNAFFVGADKPDVKGKEIYCYGRNADIMKSPAIAIQKANNSLISGKLEAARKGGAIDENDTIINPVAWNKIQEQYAEHSKIAAAMLEEIDEYELMSIDINFVKLTGKEYITLFRFYTGELKD